MDQDRLHVFTEGGLSSNIFSFSEAPLGESSSSLVDFSTRVAWSAKNPKFSGITNRVGVAAVAHRPWEDRVPSVPRWLSGQCCDTTAPGCSRRPKMFKPILLYHRPEESVLRHPPRLRLFGGHRGFSVCSAGDGTCCYLENCLGSVEETRDLFNAAGCNGQCCGPSVSDIATSGFLNCNCSSVCPLGQKGNQRAMKAAEGVRPLNRLGQMTGNPEMCCHGSCSWSDDSYPMIPQNSLSVAKQGPFPANPQTPFSAIPLTPFSITSLTANPTQTSFPVTQQTSKPYFPMHMFSRRPMTLESGSASEIRRALLLNHPVFNDTCMECSGCSGKHDGLQDNNINNNNRDGDIHTSDDKVGGGFPKNNNKLGATDLHAHKSLRDQGKAPVSSAFTFSPDLGPVPGPPTSTFPLQDHTVTTHAPVPPTVVLQTPSQNPFKSDSGVDHCWQEWAGRYGSFLQLLNSPDDPLSPGDPKSLTLQSSLVAEVPEKRLLETSSTACLRTALRGISPDQVTGLRRATLDRIAEDAEEREHRKHKCPYCNVACTNNGQLKGHLRVHTGQ